MRYQLFCATLLLTSFLVHNLNGQDTLKNGNVYPAGIRIENTPAKIESGIDRQLENAIQLLNSK